MKIIQLIVFVVVVTGWLPSAYASGNGSEVGMDVFGMAQAANDSIIAPNVFTPNDDGNNDFFEVRSHDANAVSLKIFTRAGVLIFSIKAKRCMWDGYSQTGQKMATGVYYYTAETSGVSSSVSKAGFVHLFR